MKKLGGLLLMVIVMILFTNQALALSLFRETFDVNVSGKTAFEDIYTEFYFTGYENNINVVDGVLEIGALGTIGTGHMDVIMNGFNSDLHISVDLGAIQGGGGYPASLMIGQNNIIFHPGYDWPGNPRGAFRVEGPGGFGNIDMGFVPPVNVLHHMEVDIVANTGLFDITITDANNSNNVFTASFTNIASIGGDIGFHRDGGDGISLYDNFIIDNPSPVPEPATMFLLGSGLFCFFNFKRT